MTAFQAEFNYVTHLNCQELLEAIMVYKDMILSYILRQQ